MIHAPPLLHECGFLTDDDCDDGANFFVFQIRAPGFQRTPPILVQPIFYCIRRSAGVPPSNCTMVVSGAADAEDLLDAIFLSTDWDGDGADDRFFTNVFPIADLSAGVMVNPPVLGARADGDLANNGFLSKDRVSAILGEICERSDLDALSGLFGEATGRPVYVAFVDPPMGPEGLAKHGKPCAVVKFDTNSSNRVNDNDYCRNCPNEPVWNIHYDVDTVNHEIGHTLGIAHASCDHGEDDGGGCDAAPDAFPCPHGGICLSAGARDEPFIFEPYLMRALPPRKDQKHAHDFMSYGSEPEWVSPHTYLTVFRALREALSERMAALGSDGVEDSGAEMRRRVIAMADTHAAPLRPVPRDPASVADAGATAIEPEAGRGESAAEDPIRVNYVAGRLSEPDGVAVIGPLRPLLIDPARLPAEDPESGYWLELLDADGAVLERRAVTLSPTASSFRHFSAVLPERPNAVRLVLRHGDAVLAKRTRSASPPVVTLTAPAGGEVWDAGAQTVAWQASDADGDNVAVSVQYSRDRGQSWRTLDTVAASQMLEVDGAALPGSARLGAMMRLLATDGFNGAIATSEPFTVADKAPRARILSPESGQSVGKNAYLELSGHSVDPEDGALSGEALSWRSDRDGALGKGLTVSPRLSPGGHWITFSARDSDGNVATDLLRLIVKDAPSHQPVADAGADQEVYAGDAVQVDGSNSFDTDGDALGYDWRVVSAPAVVSLDLADPARPEFEAAAAGVYAFELRVSDGTVGSYPDRVTVTVR